MPAWMTRQPFERPVGQPGTPTPVSSYQASLLPCFATDLFAVAVLQLCVASVQGLSMSCSKFCTSSSSRRRQVWFVLACVQQEVLKPPRFDRRSLIFFCVGPRGNRLRNKKLEQQDRQADLQGPMPCRMFRGGHFSPNMNLKNAPVCKHFSFKGLRVPASAFTR